MSEPDATLAPAATIHTPELGRLVAPYGGVTHCGASECRAELNEEVGAYLYRDLETGNLVILCGSCGAYVELHRRDRFLLIAL